MTLADARAAHNVANTMLADQPDAGHARTIARLHRYALEHAVDTFWQQVRPGQVAAGRGRRLRLLRAYDAATATQAYATWCMLSDASHPRLYELPPPDQELRSLGAQVGQLLDAVDHLAATAPRDPAARVD